MLKKSFYLAILTLLGVCLAGCDRGGNIPEPEDYTLTKGFATIDDGETFPVITLSLTNTPGESPEEYTAPGAFINLILVADVPTGEAVIPAENYLYSAETDTENTIVRGVDSYFAIFESQGKREYIVTGGNITVSESDGVYTVSGLLLSGDKEFEVVFTGTIATEDHRELLGPNDEWGEFTTATVAYNNRYLDENTAGSLFDYVVEFKNQTQNLKLELMAPVQKSGYYNIFADGEYTYTATVSESSLPTDLTIVGQNSKYINEHGDYFAITGGSLNIVSKTLDADPTGYVGREYTITGDLEGLYNGGKLKVKYTGALPIEKATLKLEWEETDLQGQYWTFSSYEYYTKLVNGPAGEWDGILGIGEQFTLMFTAPLNRYYEYFPIASGQYDVDWEDFTPYHILANDYVSDCGVYFTRSDGYGTMHTIKDGSMNVESSGTEAPYALKMSGEFETEVVYERDRNGNIKEKYFTEKEGHKMTIEFEYDGTNNGAHFVTRNTTHPSSNITENRNHSFTIGGMDWCGSGWWELESGTDSDATYVEIYLADGDLLDDEWYGWWTDDGNADTWILCIGICLPASADDDPYNIPTGTYSIDELYTLDTSKKMFMPGFRQGEVSNIFYGTYYFNEADQYSAPIGYGIDGGSVYIGINASSQYHIEVKLYDDLAADECHTITGVYVGDLPDIWSFPLDAGFNGVRARKAGNADAPNVKAPVRSARERGVQTTTIPLRAEK